MVGTYKLVDVGRNKLISLSNININESHINEDIHISDIKKCSLLAEYGIYVAKENVQVDSCSDVQISGSFGINILNCHNCIVRVIITTMTKLGDEAIIYTADTSLNNYTNIPKYKLINFITLASDQTGLTYGYHTHRLYVICNTPITLIGPIIFQGLSFLSNAPDNDNDILSFNLTIDKIVSDNKSINSTTIIPFSSGNKLAFKSGDIYLTSYGNFICMKSKQLESKIDISEPYGALCTPKKTAYRGISCRFTYKGADIFYPLSRIQIKIGIYINDPDKDNTFTKISDHTIAEFDYGDAIKIDQLFNVTDNSINHIIDGKMRILPIFTIIYDDLSDDEIVGCYAGNILLE